MEEGKIILARNVLKYWEQEMFSLCQCTSARNFWVDKVEWNRI